MYELNDDDIPKVIQLKSFRSYTLNPFTKSLLGYVNILFEGRVLFEMDRESLFDEVAWTHEFSEMALTKTLFCICDESYSLCRCDLDCTVSISWLGRDDLRLPVCHFAISVITSCNLPNPNGYEKVDGDRVWDLAMEQRKKKPGFH